MHTNITTSVAQSQTDWDKLYLGMPSEMLQTTRDLQEFLDDAKLEKKVRRITSLITTLIVLTWIFYVIYLYPEIIMLLNV